MEIYLHVPYCRQKCRYCDFASFPHAESTQRAYVDAVLTEAASQAAKLPHGAMETAYLGGGTPSILPPELLTQLLEGVTAHFPLAPGAEFTSEANPGTLTHEWLDAALNCGINRLSMGMQAAQPALLKMLGRIHDFTQVQQSVELARHAGFQHISLDLMFGLPGQTVSMWRETLEKALSLNPEHLSCYGLIPEEGTPLYHDLQTGQLTLPDEDDERRMYDLTLDLLAQSGFRQYEISNFARPGCECRWRARTCCMTKPIGWQRASKSNKKKTDRRFASTKSANKKTSGREKHPPEVAGQSSINSTRIAFCTSIPRRVSDHRSVLC